MTELNTPSPWVEKYYSFIKGGGAVLDLACGSGRHTHFLMSKGYQLTAVDKDINAITAAELTDVSLLQADLEAGLWPFGPNLFDGIVVVNYLWRPQFPHLARALKKGGVLIFDTFGRGNEVYGRPKNPDFLLRSGELKDAFSEFECLEFFEGLIENPGSAVRQSIVARKIK